MTNLTQLINCKRDIKSAIIEKGVEVTGGLTSYADAIRSIEGDLPVGSLPDKTKLKHNLWTVGPELNTSAMTDMSSMFAGCYNMTSMSLFDTSKVTDMSYMFDSCNDLITVPLFDTSNVTNMRGMFGWCGALVTIPQFDTSNVTDMSDMFHRSLSLESLPELDCSSVTTVSSMFQCDSYMARLTSVGGFKNLGMQPNLTGTNSAYFLAKCPKLGYRAVNNIINNLYDRASAGYSVLTLRLDPDVLDMLYSVTISEATRKGWTLAS